MICLFNILPATACFDVNYITNACQTGAFRSNHYQSKGRIRMVPLIPSLGLLSEH